MERHDRPDLLDSRFILYGYAVVVAPIGLFVALWGSAWAQGPLNGQIYGIDALVRIAGTVVLGVGLIGAALGRTSDPLERRRGLLWLAVAHIVVLTMVWMQLHAIWDYELAPPMNAAVVSLAMGCAWLMGGWLHGIAGRPRPTRTLGLEDAAEPVVARSAYEQRIRQIAAQEERGRLARDLHDSIKQQIFAIHTAAATTETRLETDSTGARQSIAQVRDAARDASAEMDALLDQLRVTPLENSSFVEAITRQAEALRLRTGADVTCYVNPLPPDEALPPGAHLALFRAVQEALSNVARHGRASNVQIRLKNNRLTAATGRLELTIRDNGAGFNHALVQAGMGLANIRMRLAEIGGRATVVSRDGEGATVTLDVPYRKDVPQALLWHALALGVALAAIILTWADDASKFYLAVPAVFVAVDALHYAVRWRRVRHLTGRPA